MSSQISHTNNQSIQAILSLHKTLENASPKGPLEEKINSIATNYFLVATKSKESKDIQEYAFQKKPRGWGIIKRLFGWIFGKTRRNFDSNISNISKQFENVNYSELKGEEKQKLLEIAKSLEAMITHVKTRSPKKHATLGSIRDTLNQSLTKKREDLNANIKTLQEDNSLSVLLGKVGSACEYEERNKNLHGLNSFILEIQNQDSTQQNPTELPDEIKKYREKVRTSLQEFQTRIDNAATLEEVKNILLEINTFPPIPGDSDFEKEIKEDYSRLRSLAEEKASAQFDVLFGADLYEKLNSQENSNFTLDQKLKWIEESINKRETNTQFIEGYREILKIQGKDSPEKLSALEELTTIQTELRTKIESAKKTIETSLDEFEKKYAEIRKDINTSSLESLLTALQKIDIIRKKQSDLIELASSTFGLSSNEDSVQKLLASIKTLETISGIKSAITELQSKPNIPPPPQNTNNIPPPPGSVQAKPVTNEQKPSPPEPTLVDLLSDLVVQYKNDRLLLKRGAEIAKKVNSFSDTSKIKTLAEIDQVKKAIMQLKTLSEQKHFSETEVAKDLSTLQEIQRLLGNSTPAALTATISSLDEIQGGYGRQAELQIFLENKADEINQLTEAKDQVEVKLNALYKEATGHESKNLDEDSKIISSHMYEYLSILLTELKDLNSSVILNLNKEFLGSDETRQKELEALFGEQFSATNITFLRDRYSKTGHAEVKIPQKDLQNLITHYFIPKSSLGKTSVELPYEKKDVQRAKLLLQAIDLSAINPPGEDEDYDSDSDDRATIEISKPFLKANEKLCNKYAPKTSSQEATSKTVQDYVSQHGMESLPLELQKGYQEYLFESSIGEEPSQKILAQITAYIGVSTNIDFSPYLNALSPEHKEAGVALFGNSFTNKAIDLETINTWVKALQQDSQLQPIAQILQIKELEQLTRDAKVDDISKRVNDIQLLLHSITSIVKLQATQRKIEALRDEVLEQPYKEKTLELFPFIGILKTLIGSKGTLGFQERVSLPELMKSTKDYDTSLINKWIESQEEAYEHIKKALDASRMLDALVSTHKILPEVLFDGKLDDYSSIIKTIFDKVKTDRKDFNPEKGEKGPAAALHVALETAFSDCKLDEMVKSINEKYQNSSSQLLFDEFAQSLVALTTFIQKTQKSITNEKTLLESASLKPSLTTEDRKNIKTCYNDLKNVVSKISYTPETQSSSNESLKKVQNDLATLSNAKMRNELLNTPCLTKKQLKELQDRIIQLKSKENSSATQGIPMSSLLSKMDSFSNKIPEKKADDEIPEKKADDSDDDW